MSKANIKRIVEFEERADLADLLSNLVYMARLDRRSPKLVEKYMALADGQLHRITDLH